MPFVFSLCPLWLNYRTRKSKGHFYVKAGFTSSYRKQTALKMRNLLLPICFLFLTCHTKAQTDTSRFTDFVRSVLEDGAKDETLYPKPPPITPDVAKAMEEEFRLFDSAQYYFIRLCTDSLRKQYYLYGEALRYFASKDMFNTMMALTVHWSPDVRVYSQVELQKLIHRGLLINDRKLKTGKRREEFQRAIRFLIYVLEDTPWFISGSENATIHSVYLQNIGRSLDYLTGERQMVNQQNYYSTTEQQMQQSIAVWKKHITESQQ